MCVCVCVCVCVYVIFIVKLCAWLSTYVNGYYMNLEYKK